MFECTIRRQISKELIFHLYVLKVSAEQGSTSSQSFTRDITSLQIFFFQVANDQSMHNENIPSRAADIPPGIGGDCGDMSQSICPFDMPRYIYNCFHTAVQIYRQLQRTYLLLSTLTILYILEHCSSIKTKMSSSEPVHVKLQDNSCHLVWWDLQL
ncbi:hypothetical protein ABKN59_004385 [Abortiporus biennis]